MWNIKYDALLSKLRSRDDIKPETLSLITQAIEWKEDKIQNNYEATTYPTGDDDISEWYSVWSIWYNLTYQEAFICVDNTEWVAVWLNTTLTVDELGSMAFESVDNYYDKATIDWFIWWGWSWWPILSAVIAWEVTVWTVIEMPVSKTITAGTFRVSLKTLPTGADVIVKLYKNWVEDASVTIATGASATNWLYQWTDTTFVSGSYVAWDVLKVSVTQIGSTLAGTGLSILLNE